MISIKIGSSLFDPAQVQVASSQGQDLVIFLVAADGVVTVDTEINDSSEFDIHSAQKEVRGNVRIKMQILSSIDDEIAKLRAKRHVLSQEIMICETVADWPVTEHKV